MGIIDKTMIETWILPQLTVGERGFATTVPLTEIVECIFHRLKTGCQWRELPTKQYFTHKVLHWNSVFYYYNKWSKADCWRKIWVNLLSKKRQYLDLSSVELDGSHTPTKNGGDAVGYQGRKACNPTNALFCLIARVLCWSCPLRRQVSIMMYSRFRHGLMKSVSYSKPRISI
jgi:transposase